MVLMVMALQARRQQGTIMGVLLQVWEANSRGLHMPTGARKSSNSGSRVGGASLSISSGRQQVSSSSSTEGMGSSTSSTWQRTRMVRSNTLLVGVGLGLCQHTRQVAGR